MKIKVRKDGVEFIPENSYDRRLSTDLVETSLNKKSSFMALLASLSEEDCKVISDAMLVIYCAGLSDGRLTQQVDSDSRSYQV